MDGKRGDCIHMDKHIQVYCCWKWSFISLLDTFVSIWFRYICNFFCYISVSVLYIRVFDKMSTLACVTENHAENRYAVTVATGRCVSLFHLILCLVHPAVNGKSVLFFFPKHTLCVLHQP